MRIIELTQEQVDQLSLFIEDHINEENNNNRAIDVVEVFNKLPDSEATELVLAEAHIDLEEEKENGLLAENQ